MKKNQMNQLQALCKQGVLLSESKGIIYADFVEDNGDEFRLVESKSLEEVKEYLNSHGLIKKF